MNYNNLNVIEKWIVDNYLDKTFKLFNKVLNQKDIDIISTYYQYIVSFATANGRNPRDKAELDGFISQSQLARNPITQSSYDEDIEHAIALSLVDQNINEARGQSTAQALEQLNRFDNAIYNPAPVARAPVRAPAPVRAVAPAAAQNDPWKDVPQSQAEYDNFTDNQEAESNFLDTIEVDEGSKSALDLATGLNVDYKKFLAHSPKNYILINDTNGDKTCYSLDDIIHQSLDTNRIPEVYYECNYNKLIRPQIENGRGAPMGFGAGDYDRSVEYVKIDYMNTFIVKPNWNRVPAEPRMFKLVSTGDEKYLLSRYISKGGPNVDLASGIHCAKEDNKMISNLVPITANEKAAYDAAYAAAAGGKRKIKKYKKLSKTNKKTKKRVIKKMRKNRKKTRKTNKKY
jgi:hypothetical protein